jgi:hypothetical protein
MIKNGRVVCDWCGMGFRGKPEVEYTDGRAYHSRCLKKVGGPTDLGRNATIYVEDVCVETGDGEIACGKPVRRTNFERYHEQDIQDEFERLAGGR